MHPFGLSILSLAMAMVAPACSKDKTETPSAGKTSDTPAVFTGTLDVAAINSADGIVEPFVEWSEGFAKLKSKMGEPTLVEENRYYWAVISGDSCTFIYVSKDNEAEFFKDKPDPKDMVGTVAHATTVEKSDDYGYAPCAKAVGAASATP